MASSFSEESVEGKKRKSPTKNKKNVNLVHLAKQKIMYLAPYLAIVLILYILFAFYEQETLSNITTSTTPYSCYPLCTDSGSWDAKNLSHDTGHAVADGWESDKGGFGYLVAGQYIQLAKGKYEILFEMRIDDNSHQEDVAFIEASKERGQTILGRTVKASDFHEVNKYQNFSLILTSEVNLKDVEFRVHYDRRQDIVGISRIYLVQL